MLLNQYNYTFNFCSELKKILSHQAGFNTRSVVEHIKHCRMCEAEIKNFKFLLSKNPTFKMFFDLILRL